MDIRLLVPGVEKPMSSNSVPGRQFTEKLPPDQVIFGSGSTMDAIREKLAKVAGTNIPILIHGESGTGKEVIAKYIHENSVWSAGSFVKVNCPAIPDTLIESELFGYEAGSFTGATGTKPGRVEAARCGTLFLDEISELALTLQPKLLQLLQDGRFCPIGGREDKQVDVRVICTTNRQLQQEIAAGHFRQDLYYRINVVSIHLPPLRERLNDLPFLVSYFLEQHHLRYGVQTTPISPATMALLKSYDWPGNIRELENLTKRFAIFGTEDVFTTELHGTREIKTYEPDIPIRGSISLKKVTREATKNLEMKIILNILEANQGNRRRTAQALNISYRALMYKLKEAGLDAQPEPIHVLQRADTVPAGESSDDSKQSLHPANGNARDGSDTVTRQLQRGPRSW